MDMYLYGASGHAKVIKDILESQGKNVIGVVDDNPSLESFSGMRVMHSADALSPFIVSIGNNRIRKMIVQRLRTSFGTGIHSSAIISPSVKVGEGTVVMAGAIVNAETTIGNHCIINTGATIDHECTIDNYVHISPNTTLCGNVHVAEGAWVGAGTVVIQGITIGSWSQIGAGSVVVKDIPDGVLAYGNPCRVIRKLD